MARDPAPHVLPAPLVGDFTLGRQVARLALLWRREVDIELRPFGLTDAQWRPLYWLGRLGVDPSQADLARVLDLEAPSLVRLLDVLERIGLVERFDDPSDRRLKRLRLTVLGRERYAQIDHAVETVERRLLIGVSPEEQATCNAVLARIEAGIRARTGAQTG